MSEYHNSRWRRLCSLPLSEVPPYSTLVYRSHHPKVKGWQERLYCRMLKALLNCRNLGLLAIDMTDLPRDLRDKLADRGVCGKGPFYGHKIHLYAVADAAYDTVKLYESFADLGAQLIAAVNLRNNEKLKGGCRGRLVRSWESGIV